MNDLEIHEGGLEHRTDNIEEIVQEAHKIAIDYMDRVGLKQAAIKNVPYNSPIYLFEQLKEYLRTSIHHQLQKAREEERERCFQKICSVRGDIRDKALFEATEMFIEAFDFLDVNKDSL